MKEYHVALKIAAYFLEYPDENWRQDFSEYRAVIAAIKNAESQ